jgi:hypothetical protein
MRSDIKEEDRSVLPGLLYIVAYALACGLGYLLGNYLFDKHILEGRIGLLPLILLYVVLYFANGFVAAVLFSVFEFFKKRNLFNLPKWLNFFSFAFFAFLSHLVSLASFLFLYFWLSGWDSGKLFDFSVYVLIYFILPLGVNLFAMNLILKAMGYSFILEDEEKAMVQGSQSEAVSSTNHKEVKADKPIVWNFADYAKRMVVGQDHAIDTIQKVLIANSKLADLGNPRRQRILASFLFVGPTGVGKTETAKALAGWLKYYGYDYLRIDANQFSDREAVWTLRLERPLGVRR